MLWLRIGSALADPLGPSATPAPPADAQLTVTVLEEGRLVAGVDVVVEGRVEATTDLGGSAALSVRPGRRFVQFVDAQGLVAELDLVTVEGEEVELSVIRERGEVARVDLAETSTHRGAIVGFVRHVEHREPVAGARLRFGATVARAGRDGSFMVELPAGDYSVRVEPKEGPAWWLDHVRVVPDHRVVADVELLPDGVQLREYEVAGPYVEGEIALLVAEEREVTSVEDAWDVERIAATRANTVADALDRVPGITVEQGRFALFRGQPARYGTTLFNGSPLPSVEPLIHSSPFDLLPAGVLSRLDVQRGYSTDRPAGFGAGAVDLRTARLPEEPFFDIGLTTGVNTQGSLSYASTDVERAGLLGFVGMEGDRHALPDEVAQAIADGGDLNALAETERDQLARTFSDDLAPYYRFQPPDLGVSLVGGGQTAVGRGTVAAVGALAFRNRWRQQYRSDNDFRWGWGYDRGNPDPTRRTRSENRTDNDADLAGLVSVNGRFRGHQFGANTLYVHQTQRRTWNGYSYSTRGWYGYDEYYGYYGGYGYVSEGYSDDTMMSWVARRLLAQQLTSRHDLDKLRIDTRLMISSARRDAPDQRSYGFSERAEVGSGYTYYGGPRYDWRRLPTDDGLMREYSTVDDVMVSWGVDASLAVADPIDRFVGLVLKAGVSGHDLERRAVTLRYNWQANAFGRNDNLTYDPARLYSPIATGTRLDFFDLSSARPDDFVGTERAFGAYALGDLRVGDRAKFLAGLRYEPARAEVVSYRTDPSEADAVVSSWQADEVCLVGANCALYPSASAVVEPLDRMRLWMAWGRSTARPDLHELASTPYLDPDEGERLVGTVDLRPTVVNGLDTALVWDASPSAGLRVGGFLRDYTDAVERVHLTADVNDTDGTFTNLGSARTVGLEVGGRAKISSLYGDGDFVITRSTITTSPFVRPVRPLDGQVTYTIDVQAGYARGKHDLGFTFDMVGRRQHRASSEGRGTVFLQPIPKVALYWNWDAYQYDDMVGGIQVRLQNLPDSVWRFFETSDLVVNRFQDSVWREYRRGAELTANLVIGVR